MTEGMTCYTCGKQVGCACSKQWHQNSVVKWCWGFIIGCWLTMIGGLFLSCSSGDLGAMPWQPFALVTLIIGGLTVMLLVHILLRKFLK